MAAVGLIADQLDCETYSMPTGARIFERGTPAHAIYTVRQGVVELIGDQGEKIRYGSGELFSYQDIIWRDGLHRSTALARSPVEILRLDRLSFLNLLHHHPTLALILIGQQHHRLRAQRSTGSYCY